MPFFKAVKNSDYLRRYPQPSESVRHFCPSLSESSLLKRVTFLSLSSLPEHVSIPLQTLGPNVAELMAVKETDAWGPRPVLRAALIRRRPRLPTDVPAVMLFDLRDDVNDILMILDTNQTKEQTSKLIFWEIHPFTCCLIDYFVKVPHLMFIIMRRVVKQLKHHHSLVLVKIR